MNGWGWIFMLTSLALVWGTAIWAYRRLLSAPRTLPDEEHTAADPLVQGTTDVD